MVFILREIEQMDYESIADLLRIPLGTVRSRLALRARPSSERSDAMIVRDLDGSFLPDEPSRRESWRSPGTSSRATALFLMENVHASRE